ncbi:hypothetical protein TNCV_3315001 [Trichonephila clavipes]|nr:hypothetical protein TNCV_3315001 [Trichonephila clavipes]
MAAIGIPPIGRRTQKVIPAYDEAGLFFLIAKSGADRRGKIADISLIAGKEFRNWVVRYSDPLFPGCPDR